MNLPELTPMQHPREYSLQRRAASAGTNEGAESKPNRAALIAGAAAFLLTATLISAGRKVERRRAVKRYFNGETTDRLAASADTIAGMIEIESRRAAASGSYPAAFPLELEREQHRLIEAYADLYRTLDAEEKSRLVEPERLLLFNGIAAFQSLPAEEAQTATPSNRGRALGKLESAAAVSRSVESELRFVPNEAQRQSLGNLYRLCLEIRELADIDNRSSYGAERSERSAARMLDGIGRRAEDG